MNTTNPLIGTSKRETIENAAEALSAAVVLLADKHSGLCRLLTPILDVMEREDVTGDADAIDGAAEAFSAAIVLMADRHSDLCRLLMPVLHALEHAASEGATPARGATREEAIHGQTERGVGLDETSLVALTQHTNGTGDPVAEYNSSAARLRGATREEAMNSSSKRGVASTD